MTTREQFEQELSDLYDQVIAAVKEKKQQIDEQVAHTNHLVGK